MATRLWFAPQGDYSTGTNDANLRGTNVAWDSSQLVTAIPGGAGTTASVTTPAGPTAGVEIAATAIAFYSAPLAAAVTISGAITWNIWGNENNMSANVAINGRLEVIDGATGVITLIDQTARVVELNVTTDTVNNFAETPAAGVACKKGDRLRVRIFGDDAGTMGSGFSFSVTMAGSTPGATGDSWLELTETVTFASEPAGSQMFLTDTASAVATAAVDREAWTSRGAGVQTDVTNTANGWTAPIQLTDTAGGTVVEWYTRALGTETLGGAARCNLRGLCPTGSASGAAFAVEIARVDNDGTNPTVWARGTNPVRFGTSEAAQSFLVSGNDLAITNGQRLRIRVFIDDYGGNVMVGGTTVTSHYAGTSGGASGDSYVTFSQTFLEYALTMPYVSPYPQILAQ